MKTKKILFFLLIAAFAIFMVGCDKEDDVNEFEVLADYLEGSDGGYINNMGSWIVNLKDINTSDYFVLDTRSAADYANEHIAGAVNSTLSGMFDAVEARGNKTVLVVCYSGQTASFAHTLLNLKDVPAKVLKFGMSIFSQDHDKWTAKCSDKNAGDLVKTASPSWDAFDYPELNTGEEDGEKILDERIDATIAKWGTLLLSADEVVNNSSAYNVVNYWPEAVYLGHGHINGAYQVTPGMLKQSENLSAFDDKGTNVFYCYTGQTAAASIAYLTVLGYDVKSIAYGFNNMHWSELPGHKWPKPYGG